MPDLYMFDEESMRILQELVTREKNKRINTTNRPAVDTPLPQSPETYYALTPPGGIPARAANVPGSAVCNIYQIVPVAGIDTLEAITGLTRTVYNVHSTAIDGSVYVMVGRDKFSKWGVLSQPGESAGTGTDGETLFSGARVSHSVGQAIAISTTIVPTFDTEIFDTDSYHSTSVNPERITIPTTGYYEVGCHFLFSSYTEIWSGTAFLILNNTDNICVSREFFVFVAGQTGAGGPRVRLITVRHFTAGDYLSLELRHDSTAAQSIAGLDGLQETPAFWIYKIG